MKSPEFNSEQKKTHLHDTMIFWKQIVRMQLHKRLNARELAPRARFELATLRLTAEMIENLSALSGVACEKLGAILPSLVAPTPAPTRHLQNRGASVATMLTLLVVPFSLKLIRPAPNQHEVAVPGRFGVADHSEGIA